LAEIDSSLHQIRIEFSAQIGLGDSAGDGMIWLGDGTGEPGRPYISILDKPSVSSLISEMLLLHYKAISNLDGVLVNLGEQWCTDF
jgi:hypothetical protein